MQYKEFLLPDGTARARISLLKPEGSGIGECHLVATCSDAEAPLQIQLRKLHSVILEAQAHIGSGYKPVLKRYFLKDASDWSLIPDNHGCAESVIGQSPVGGSKVAVWAYYMEDATVQPTEWEGITEVRHGAYRHLWLTNSVLAGADSKAATEHIMGAYDKALRSLGCTLYDHCMRTWIFVGDIDHNYAGMVQGRNEVFASLGLTPSTHFISSTGIAGASIVPDAVVQMDAYAVGGIAPEQVKYLHAPANLNPTHEYGVAFERGTSIDYGDRRHVLISGTASINNKGQVVHVGDVRSQAQLMLSNVEALLQDAGTDFGSLAVAIVYLREPADYAKIADVLASRLGQVPYVVVDAPVCRPTWLVELECIAIVPQTDNRYQPF